MKVSNETKVGALTIVAITLIILGFNFLRGKTIFKSGHFIYAKYADTKGLIVSNPVFVNGFQVGTVFEIENKSQFEELLHSIKEYKNYTPWQDSTAKVKQAKEPNVDFSRVKYLLDIYTKYIEMKKVNPDLSYADFAINQNLNPKVKIEKTDMPNEVRDKRAVLANNTDYHLSKARAIMANATVLDFPSIDEKSWICQQVLDSFDDDLKYF